MPSNSRRLTRTVFAKPRVQQLSRRRTDQVGGQRVSELIRENVFESFQERIIYPLAAGVSLVFAPLAVNHFRQGNYALAILIVTVVLMLVIDAIAIHLKKPAPVPYPMVLVVASSGVGIAMLTQGIDGALWCYPAVMAGYFVLQRRAANILGIALLGIATGVIYADTDPATTLRFFLSLAFCLVIVNILLDVLDTVHGKLLAQSLTDPLTGAFNRRHMDTCLHNMLERYRRSGAAGSVLIIDIDRFKQINDCHGHMKGDKVLRDVVGLIDERSRKLDTVFRMGGDEFLVLLPDTHATQARVVAEHLRAAVEATQMLSEETITVTVGISEIAPGDAESDLLKRADAALYRAKEAGRNRVEVNLDSGRASARPVLVVVDP